MFFASCGLLFSQDVVTHTGEPNYLIARVPVPSAMNVYNGANYFKIMRTVLFVIF